MENKSVKFLILNHILNSVMVLSGLLILVFGIYDENFEQQVLGLGLLFLYELTRIREALSNE